MLLNNRALLAPLLALCMQTLASSNDLLNYSASVRTTSSASNNGSSTANYALNSQILWSHDLKKQKIQLGYRPELIISDQETYGMINNHQFDFNGFYAFSPLSTLTSKNKYTFGQNLLDLSDQDLPYVTQLTVYNYQSGQYTLTYDQKLKRAGRFSLGGDIVFFTPTQIMNDTNVLGTSSASVKSEYLWSFDSRTSLMASGYGRYTLYSNNTNYFMSGPGLTFKHKMDRSLTLTSAIYNHYLMSYASETLTNQQARDWIEAFMQADMNKSFLRMGFDSAFDSTNALLNQRIYTRLNYSSTVTKRLNINFQAQWNKIVLDSPRRGDQTLNMAVNGLYTTKSGLSVELGVRHLRQLYPDQSAFADRTQWTGTFGLSYRSWMEI